jgi:hypothetical protein
MYRRFGLLLIETSPGPYSNVINPKVKFGISGKSLCRSYPPMHRSRVEAKRTTVLIDWCVVD